MNYRHVSCVPNVASVFRVSLTLTYTYIYLIIKTPELYMNEARYHLAMYHDSNLKIKFQCKSIRKLSDTTRTDITKKHVYLC
jgi:hypothetical protein